MFSHFLKRWEEGKNFQSSDNLGNLQKGRVGMCVNSAQERRQELEQRKAQSSYMVSWLKLRELWLSHQSTFIILVPIFFDSHGFSFFPNVFGVKPYGHETEQLKMLTKNFGSNH